MITKILVNGLKLIAVLLVLFLILFFAYGSSFFEKSTNTVTLKTTDIKKNSWYDSIPFIADLHCDALLWNRDLTKKHNYGHVDIPRMQEANMAFQVFTIVSKTPRGINIEQNSDKTDNVAILSFAQMQPWRNWFSIKSRALWQCNQLYHYADKSEGKFRVINSRKTLEQYLIDRKKNRNLTAGMLGLEGAHCLENSVENLKDFYNAGVRYIGLTHFFDNEWGGSAHGMKKDGLTAKGILLVHEMEKLHITIDLAHASPKTIDDVLANTTAPLLVSHTGVKGICENRRNLSDAHLIEIGKRNGLIGIGLWETAVCGTDAAATAKSIRYVADKIGVDKVALGSDFDGAIKTHFDVTGLPLIVAALEKEKFSRADIEKIMGANIRDFFLRNLPEE
ncbi:MAG: dipeptidase [Chitinophagaceae bacterium]|nr:dipeptidase [Chitinophagaceae bacterium]